MMGEPRIWWNNKKRVIVGCIGKHTGYIVNRKVYYLEEGF